MDNTQSAKRLAEIAKEELKAIRKLRLLHAERCQLLCAGYTANASALDLDPAIDPGTIAPKD